jgi:uncharacterized protein YfaS (alpha-2-macroglobulin family)
MGAIMRSLSLFAFSLLLFYSSVAMAQKFRKFPEANKAFQQEIKKLVDEQKYKAAKKVAEDYIAKHKEGNQFEYTRGLLERLYLQMGLHGYETSVKELMQSEWPKDPTANAIVTLYYAYSLINYFNSYSWEIEQREEFVATGEVDLKKWTKSQIEAEVTKAFTSVWSQRAALGEFRTQEFSEFFNVNDFPPQVRPSLRDALSYLFAQHLRNSSFWSPKESNEVYFLNQTKLLKRPHKLKNKQLKSEAIHPLAKMSFVLHDLANWHKGSRSWQAYTDALVTNVSSLNQHFQLESAKQNNILFLQKMIKKTKANPWMGRAYDELARTVMSTTAPDANVKALEILDKCTEKNGKDKSGEYCVATRASLLAPSYTMQTMLTDGKQRESLLISYKNLDKLHFRAYKLDLKKYVLEQSGYNAFLNYEQIKALITSPRKPNHSWVVDLKKTADYNQHQKRLKLNFDSNGYYLILASARRDFKQTSNNLLRYVNFIQTDMVLVKQTQPNETVKIRAVRGSQGQPIPGVNIRLYERLYQDKPKLRDSAVTDSQGYLTLGKSNRRGSLFFYASKGQDALVDNQGVYLYRANEPRESYQALIYTDRSIYRPGQTVFFKVHGFKGSADRTRFSVKEAKGRSFDVLLKDQNYKDAAKAKVKLNDFGTGSGEFLIPVGRTLGSWQIQANLDTGLAFGSTSIKVEEYKRPTFEVALSQPKSALRLNKAASIKGSVKYYFGLPVTEGQVRYKVTRSQLYPWWWDWCFFWGWGGAKPPQIVKNGKASLNNKGEFEVEFTPKVAKAYDNPNVTYDYSVAVDVTDIGGETRSASGSYQVGRVAVTASIAQLDSFIEPSESSEFQVTRTSLNGLPLKGKGRWQLYRIRQPQKTRNQSEELSGLPPGQKPSPFAHEDDRKQARWTASSRNWRQTVFHWPTSKKVKSGGLSHNASGVGKFKLGRLDSGFYRILYTTKDEFGASFEQRHDFYVAGANLNYPLLVQVDKGSYEPGETARVFLHSGFKGQKLRYQVVRGTEVLKEGEVSKPGFVLEFPVSKDLRGGFSVHARLVNDYQMSYNVASVFVPWTHKVLNVEFSKFREKIRPGTKQTFNIKLSRPKGQPPLKEAAEVLVYMYDRSLDAFVSHSPKSLLNIFGNFTGISSPFMTNISSDSGSKVYGYSWARLPSPPYFQEDSFKFYNRWGIGGLGPRTRGKNSGSFNAFSSGAGDAQLMASDLAEGVPQASMVAPKKKAIREKKPVAKSAARPATEEQEKNSESQPEEEKVRSNFSETAFWKPHLKANKEGEVSLSFDVPDSVTDWNVWALAMTKDLKAGSAVRTAKSVKDLMVRPYMPRFFREADQADLKIVVNNASDKSMKVNVKAEIYDTQTEKNLMSEFGLKGKAWSKVVTVSVQGSASVSMPVKVPSKISEVSFKVTAKSGDISDGELRNLPILPSRMHLLQSKFVTLRKGKPRKIDFKDMRDQSDKSLIHKQLVLTLDAQLFYSVLTAVPYLVDYPYLCTEQTLNRFISTSILHQMFKKYPGVSKMAGKMAKKRGTQLEQWNKNDPNRMLFLEETPWLNQAEGGRKSEDSLLKVLDPKVAKSVIATSLERLKQTQVSDGGFPWFPGGRPSAYITLLVVHGFSKATEFGAKLPKELVVKAWQYIHREFKARTIEEQGLYFLVFTNYLASAFPDESWTGGYFTAAERKKIADYTFARWKKLSPYLKAYLSLTLHRMKRKKDAKLVFDSIMESSTTTEDEGTFWAAEDRSWLWYNDTIEGHAYTLRAMMELSPKDKRREGLVQWLFLNKKLGHWKSTRATAEVLYSLVHYLDKESQLGIKEQIKAEIGDMKKTFNFSPEEYTGKSRQWVVSGKELKPLQHSKITVEKTDKALGFASATWHFSTEKLPEKGVGDFLQVERKYYLRKVKGDQMSLVPLNKGDKVAVGDEVEIQIGIKSKHQFEYVHLRDPRPAGFEPGVVTSGWEWDLGLPRYKEIRDSATNFFIEWLPQGQYTLKYRVKAAMAGRFRVGPARIQSMYAPEFGAYSAGKVIDIR